MNNQIEQLPQLLVSDREVIINYHNNNAILQTMKDKEYLLFLLNKYDKNKVVLIYNGHSVIYTKQDIINSINSINNRNKNINRTINDIVDNNAITITNRVRYQTNNILDIDIQNELVSYVYNSPIPTVVVDNNTDHVLFCNNEYAIWCDENMSMWDYIKEYELIDNQLVNMNVSRFPQDEFIKYKNIINNMYLGKLTRDIHWIANVQDKLHHLYGDIINICLGKDKPYHKQVLARVVQFTNKELVTK